MEQDFSLDKQWDNIVNVLVNWGAVVSVAILNTGFEMVLWEHIRKVALSQLAVSMATGFLWFNIYLMSVEGINLQLYISCMVMGAVLLTNIGLFSESNFKKLQNVLNRKKPRKKKEGEGPTLSEDE